MIGFMSCEATTISFGGKNHAYAR